MVTITSGTVTSAWINTNTTSTGTYPISVAGYSWARDFSLRITRDSVGELPLPDGAKLVFNKGNYHIEDKNQKVTYRACNFRDFNSYLNASDLLEKFLTFLGTLGVTQSQVLNIPIEVFINWLIIEAARQDGEEPPEDIQVKSHPKLLTHAPKLKPRCLACGRFIKRALSTFQACSEPHALIAFRRLQQC